MCIHHRLIYRKCGHFTWLGITKKCQSERNFDQGKTDEGCNVMWTHPLSTYRVDRCCESCALKRATTDRAIDEIRGRIQFTRELLAKIQEASSGILEGGESEWGSEASSAAEKKLNMVDNYGDDDDEIEEAETMDLIDPNEVIKKNEQFVGGISIGLQSVTPPKTSRSRLGNKLKIKIPTRKQLQSRDVIVKDHVPLHAR
ncbi:putative endonuclease lcl3 [Neurospora sp. IMI 360204]|nr:putative endonuclease lcl3 [Neurospora sp. IMI 360204]